MEIIMYNQYGTIEQKCVQFHNCNSDFKANNTIYSDRLLQWDYARYNKLSTKHFGNESQYWYGRDADKIEAFLREWCNDNTLILIAVELEMNESNGYPIWRFDFYTQPKI